MNKLVFLSVVSLVLLVGCGNHQSQEPGPEVGTLDGTTWKGRITFANESWFDFELSFSPTKVICIRTNKNGDTHVTTGTYEYEPPSVNMVFPTTSYDSMTGQTTPIDLKLTAEMQEDNETMVYPLWVTFDLIEPVVLKKQ